MGYRGTKAEVDLNLYVLDWWFVATVDVARSFTRIRTHRSTYADAIQRRGVRPKFAHHYWAHHVTHILPARGIVTRFVLLNGKDFTLARFVRHGSDCVVPVRSPQLIRMLNSTAAKQAAQLLDPQLAHQCPRYIRYRTHVLCPWYSPACPAEHAKHAVLAIKRAEHAVRCEELLPAMELFDRSVPLFRRILRQDRFASIAVDGRCDV